MGHPPKQAQGCYNNFHQTPIGKALQFGSVTALTPADPEYKDNLKETIGLGSLKALLVGGAMKSEIGLINAAGHFAEKWAGRLGLPLVGGATALDTAALATCSGAAIAPPAP